MHWGRASLVGIVAIATVALCGCLERQLVDCGDRTACPVGYACLAAGGCATPAELAACVDVAADEACFVDGAGYGTCVENACLVQICGNGRIEPGEACDDGDEAPGDGCNDTCTSTEVCGNAILDPREECDGSTDCRSDCIIARCGNGLVDPGEICDDGDLASGDGCTPDCLSDETCGNGIRDLVAGETCEDGNTLNHDGCDKTCQPEQIVWRLIGEMPPARSMTAIVDDGHSGRAIMFGGSAGAALADTWAWSGTGWRQLFPPQSPPARHSHAMAYDAERRRVVLFGGTTNNVALFGDTWEFDGFTWTQRVPATSPSPRSGHAMTYDQANKRIVLFGGDVNAETWLWDGTNWTLAAPATSPPPRTATGLAYDVDRELGVLYGGVGLLDSTPRKDLWLWNGTTWTQVAQTTPWVVPQERFRHAMVYDRARKKTLVIGGLSGQTTSSTTTRGNVNGLDASGWISLPSLPGSCTYPLGTTTCDREQHAATYHAASNSTIVFGGHIGAAYGRETLQLAAGATSWSVRAMVPPPARTAAAMTYDRLHAVSILTGGFDPAGEFLGDTWLFDGTAWTDLQLTAPAPSARYDHALVEDPERSQLLTYGGQDLFEGTLFDTWALKKSTLGWTWQDLQIAELESPGRRWTHAMAPSPSGEPIAFGGTDALTWTWDGQWTQQTPATTPATGESPALALDTRRGRTVLVGRSIAMEWNGTDWSNVDVLPTRPSRAGHAVAYDPLRGETVLHGGTDIDPGPTLVTFGDTWAWNGSTWTSLVIGGQDPGDRGGHELVYDAARSEFLMFGGTSTADTWALRWEGNGIEENCRSAHDLDGDAKLGCADDECWPWCDPLCPPGTPGCAPNRPRCGDMTCSDLETYQACPGDCASKIEPICGDFTCDPGETCAGECP